MKDIKKLANMSVEEIENIIMPNIKQLEKEGYWLDLRKSNQAIIKAIAEQKNKWIRVSMKTFNPLTIKQKREQRNLKTYLKNESRIRILMESKSNPNYMEV